MKKNLKRTLAKVMAVALTVSLVSVAPDADAAKKPKLAKKSITVTKGKSKKVKIKNVKAKKVKKLTVKSKNKKIATVKKSGKTAIKVTGKKAGKSTKVTVKVTLKGKKKATTLTLKVKVAKANKTTPATSAAPSTSTAPGTSTAPTTSQQPGGNASANPSTNPSANPSSNPSTNPSANPSGKPSAEPTMDPNAKLEDITLTYDKKFTDADRVAFKDAVSGYKGKIDVTKYEKIQVKIASAEEIPGGDNGQGGEWYGKVALSNVSDDLYNATDDGFKEKYINDAPFQGEDYPDGYLITFDPEKDIPAAKRAQAAQYCDSISVMLANKDAYSLITLKEIKFIAPAAENPDVDEPKVDFTIDKTSVGEDIADDTATLSFSTRTEGATVETDTVVFEAEEGTAESGTVEITQNASDKTKATVKGTKAGDVTIKVTATVKNKGGKEFTVSETVKLYVEKAPTIPVAESGEVALSIAATAETAGATSVSLTSMEDKFGLDCQKLGITKGWQSAYFEIPESVDKSKIKKIRITAYATAQMKIALFGKDDLANNQYENYPFWNGSGVRREDGGLDYTGTVETYEVDLTGLKADVKAKIKGKGGYFSIGSMGSGTVTENSDYRLYAVQFVMDESQGGGDEPTPFTKKITGTGCTKFAEVDSAVKNAKEKTSVTIKLKMYSDANCTTVLKTTTGNTKITLNNTETTTKDSGGSNTIYNSGYGDGVKIGSGNAVRYLKDVGTQYKESMSMDEEGVITITWNSLSQASEAIDCISYQLNGDVKGMEILSVEIK